MARAASSGCENSTMPQPLERPPEPSVSTSAYSTVGCACGLLPVSVLVPTIADGSKVVLEVLPRDRPVEVAHVHTPGHGDDGCP